MQTTTRQADPIFAQVRDDRYADPAALVAASIARIDKAFGPQEPFRLPPSSRRARRIVTTR